MKELDMDDKYTAQEEHDIMRARIVEGEEEDIPWKPNVRPDQVGLSYVLVDEDGKLWTIVRDGEELRLRKILPHV
jgi:hypothetical protein